MLARVGNALDTRRTERSFNLESRADAPVFSTLLADSSVQRLTSPFVFSAFMGY